MHNKLHIQVNHDYGLINFTFYLSLTSRYQQFFLVNSILSTIFHVSHKNFYHLFISVIARISLKLGKIWTETTVQFLIVATALIRIKMIISQCPITNVHCNFFTLICIITMITGKPCEIAKQLLLSKMCGF